MVVGVVVLNCAIALFNFYLAWKLWRWGKAIGRAANTLYRVEGRVHRVLSPAPRYIDRGQRGTARLRQRYGVLMEQLQQLQQIFQVLRLLPLAWRKTRRTRRSRRTRR
ncbi:hypothetical protein PN462_19900 [Spirulina sp. CS-785/01]|uniref:hypothetical protein n=1 Tax=Spirulina sp. CS-785/01 TaxID=3021716 RepID=UPI00232BDC7E|nr:hypothetical protein [Spirulina sp. CS-785/01]MDB9315389.1 hypothetical protein [Spirulina sp. CS-785/01]